MNSDKVQCLKLTLRMSVTLLGESGSPGPGGVLGMGTGGMYRSFAFIRARPPPRQHASGRAPGCLPVLLSVLLHMDPP